MIYGECEAWKQGNDYTASPWGALPMCPYSTVNDRITNPVLYLDFIDHSPGKKNCKTSSDDEGGGALTR